MCLLGEHPHLGYNSEGKFHGVVWAEGGLKKYLNFPTNCGFHLDCSYSDWF